MITEIDQSSDILDKGAAREKAAELRDDQLMFLALTIPMPLVIAGATMTGPALMFSCMLSVMTTLSGVIYPARRSAIIKENSFRMNWVVDPSGYIYDSATNERIENATVSAYWIQYDGTDEFWEKQPKEDEYGTLWDASEYEQENPLLSNVDGKYAWDVPEGWWRVKCEKEGYQTTWSYWMSVPPVQTEVNIAMLANGETDDENTAGTQNSAGTQNNNQIQNNTGKQDNGASTSIKKPSVSKVKSFKAKAGKKKLTLSWKKVSNAAGYQIQISTKNPLAVRRK